MIAAVLFRTGGRDERCESAPTLACVDTGFELGARGCRCWATVDLVHGK
jgi:hypothetical protein